MKAVVIYEAGDSKKLIYEDVPTPSAKPGWSLIKVMGRGINHSEIFTRNGLSPTVRFPRILGIECVGIVEETTSKNLKEGQKVISIMGEMGRDFDGSYAEYVLLPNEQIHPIETGLTWEIFSAIPETYYTAYGSMKNLKIDDNHSILVRGGSSGVGVAFLKLVKAKCKNISVVGSTRNMDKSSMMKKAGFDDVILEENGRICTESTFDRVLELIGPATLEDTFEHTDAGGIVCSTGQLGGKWTMDGFDPITGLPANGYLTSFYSDNVESAQLQEMLDYISDNDIDVQPEKIYRLEEIQKAHEYLESSRGFGKVVVTDFTGQS